jgi:hypothetical protein
MVGAKTVARVLLAWFVVVGSAWANGLDSVSWRWTSWSPQGGVVPYQPGSNLTGRVPVSAPAAPAPTPVGAPTPVAAPAPAPLPPTSSGVRILPPVAPRANSSTAPAAAPMAVTQTTRYVPPATTVPTFYAPAAPRWTRIDTPPPVDTSGRADAFVNLTDGGFASEFPLTAGNALPWYMGSSAQKVFGGVPDMGQRMAFSRDVLDLVEGAYLRSGLRVRLTDDAGRPAAHTLSVVAGTHSPTDPRAVGVTDIGRNGFTFIDKLGNASTIDELKVAVANNVAHELMHAFGVEYHDPTGRYIDSGVADWSTLVDSNAMFSPEAVRRLSLRDFQEVGVGSLRLGAQGVEHGGACVHCQRMALAAPVPEPATVLGWGLVVGGLACGAARRRGIRLPLIG